MTRHKKYVLRSRVFASAALVLTGAAAVTISTLHAEPTSPDLVASSTAKRPKPKPTRTPTPTPTPTPTQTPSPSPTSPPPSGSPQPVGVPGTWALKFDDEFNGTSLDTTRWKALEGYRMNNTTTRAANVSVSGGNLVLTLPSSTSGAYVSSAKYDGAGANGFLLPVGGYAEARVFMPGNDTTIYNWPAWWASGPNWPASGENDIAEVLGGKMTVNYHSTSGAHNQGVIPGTWHNAFHVFGLHRKATSSDVYYDGKLVKSYPTDDNGAGESLLLNVGSTSGSNQVYGTNSQVKVDYVRAWQ